VTKQTPGGYDSSRQAGAFSGPFVEPIGGLPSGLSAATYSKAVAMVLRWEDEGENPGDLVRELFGLYDQGCASRR
jgi:hypothetical protein